MDRMNRTCPARPQAGIRGRRPRHLPAAARGLPVRDDLRRGGGDVGAHAAGGGGHVRPGVCRRVAVHRGRPLRGADARRDHRPDHLRGEPAPHALQRHPAPAPEPPAAALAHPARLLADRRDLRGHRAPLRPARPRRHPALVPAGVLARDVPELAALVPGGAAHGEPDPGRLRLGAGRGHADHVHRHDPALREERPHGGVRPHGRRRGAGHGRVPLQARDPHRGLRRHRGGPWRPKNFRAPAQEAPRP